MSRERARSLKVVLVLKTAVGGEWTLPQVDALRARGHSVTAVLPEEDGPLRRGLAERGVSTVNIGFSFRFRPNRATVVGLLGIRRTIRRLEPDVLFYHLYASALATRMASIGLGIPRIHMVPGPLFLEAPLVRMTERLLARLDTLTIGGSEFTRDLYQRLRLPCRRVISIPYGVDVGVFRPQASSAGSRVRRELGLRESTFVVVMVAFVYAPKTLVHRGCGIKGHEILLAAWSQFCATAPDAHLLLVGSGFDERGEEYRRRLIHRFDVYDARTRVTWVDSTDDVRRYYSASDVSVSPSLSENHGAAQEAGAMGVPSIVSDAGALPETVGPDCGWVIPRGNVPALVRALRDAHSEHLSGELCHRGERARVLTVARFDSVQAAEEVADAVESVVAAR